MVRERYEDFAPTLAWEKLTEVHGYGVSVETLRKWMVAEGLWRSKKRPGARVHQSRPRRPALGELVQIDGSPHAWFEDRGRRCTLIVFIDDATSRLMALRFAEAETTEAYMRTLRGYLDQHGRPVAIYSDKHSIFRVNQQHREGDLTQFTRMLKTLDIQPIHANTPQAKGLVERPIRYIRDSFFYGREGANGRRAASLSASILLSALRLPSQTGIGTSHVWLPSRRPQFCLRRGQSHEQEEPQG